MNDERITFKQSEVSYFREGDLVPVKHAGRDMFIPIRVFINAIHDAVVVLSPLGHSHSYGSLTDLPVLFSGNYNDLTNLPPARAQSSASRSLNTAYQLSVTRDVLASYSVDISATLSLTAGQQGTVFLEIANDAAFTAGVQELARFVVGNTGTLTIGLSLTQNVTGALVGYVPAGKYARLRTQNNVGTPTFNYRAGQEVLL
jgi:hypothetical protein